MSFVARFFVVLVLCSNQSMNAQNRQNRSIENTLAEKINRVSDTFSILQNKMIDIEEFAPTETQKEELRQLKVRYQAAMKQINGLNFNLPAQERIRVLKSGLKKAEGFHKELTEQILLPHQQKLLLAEEFTNMLRYSQGDYVKLIQTHFPDLFEFTDEQKAKIKDLVKESEAKVQKLVEEYNGKVREIADKNQFEFDEILTDKQRKTIEKISGREFPTNKK